MSRPRRRRSAPLIPAERLQPPKLGWSQEIDRRRALPAQDRAEATATPAGRESAEAPAAIGGGEDADAELHPGVRSPDEAPEDPEAHPDAAPDPEVGIEAQPTPDPDLAIETPPGAEAEAAAQHPADAGGRGTTEGPPAEPGPSDVAAALPPPVPAPRAHRAAAAPRPSSSAPPRAPRHSVRGPVGGPPRRQAIIAVAALLAVTCTTLVLLNVLRSQQTGAEAARPAVTSSPPALAATGTPAAETPSVTVLGGEGANDVESVPPVEALRTGLHGAAVQVSAAEGVRYVKGAAGSSGTFAALVRSVPAGSRLVALVGGGNDRSAALLPLATAVNQTIRAVQQRAPRAEIVVVGPLSPRRASPPSGVLQVRATLRAAAASTARVHFVDPIAGHWLASPSTVTPGGRLTEAGKQELARRLAGALAPYVR